MLRIAPPQAPVHQPDAPDDSGSAPAVSPPPNPGQAASDADPDADSDTDQPQMMNHKVPQSAAGYLGGDDGPFMCSKCVFFESPSSCSIVDGTIEPDACCNNFTSPTMQAGPKDGVDNDQDADQENGPDEAAQDSQSTDNSDQDQPASGGQ